ncbi:MAG: hypothetical protein KDB14_29125 [Planctomycetales bacterium]|nr:hypothetical protein [Planctomycetales bacterium]
MVYAGVCAESFGKASDHLFHLADLKISDERIRRATHRVGRERIQQREQLLRAVRLKPLPELRKGKPADVTAPSLACVMADGGRYQLLDRKPAEKRKAGKGSKQPPPQNRGDHWKESRVATFLAMDHQPQLTDPTPELPDFLKSVSIAKKLAEIGRVAGGSQTAAEEQPPSKDPPWPRANVLHKEVEASARPWNEFGEIMRARAWYLGFCAATHRIFISDGSSAIEKVQKKYFVGYTSILDLLHALSYCLAAARAYRSGDEWDWYVRWATAIWQGRVSEVIEELDQIQLEIGMPEEDASDTDPREIIRRARVYYTNHRRRMNYPKYRQQGYPITSSIIESTVKQVSRRAKGTEKFWGKPGSETILALRGDYLSDHNPMSIYWRNAQSQASGMREYGAAT